MLRVINLKVSVTNKASLQEVLCKEYPFLRGKIKEIFVARKAVDARKKPNIYFVYTLFLRVKDEVKVAKQLERERNIALLRPEEPAPIKKGTRALKYRPVVGGFGPAGMLVALYLAKEGYQPLVLERGFDVDTRTADVAEFWTKGIYKRNSNVQFGEGGAGTFSDGKLTTRVTHPRLHEIAKYFVQFGAPEEILYKHKPHVGTDKLRKMVKNLRRQVSDWGGEIRFNAQVTDLEIVDGRVQAVIVNGEERIPTETVLMGIGHSARDTYEMLFERQVAMEAKPFAIGVRIEHDQHVINENQYGEGYEDLDLGAAEYSLVYHDSVTSRSAYSFCMCPGGLVVAGTSEEEQVVTNGMSLYARDSGIANSAIVVTVGPEDYGYHPLDGVAFQRKWEHAAFLAGGKAYKAPIQSVGSFLFPGETVKLGLHSYQPGVVEADLHTCLPGFVTEVLERALPYFGQRIKGFDDKQVCMTGVETRTSAPLRITRNKDRQSVAVLGLFPMGEGAGYAGGIMSAALDGAETAIALMEMVAPKESANGGE